MSFDLNFTEEDAQEYAGRLQEPVIAEAELESLGSKSIGSDDQYDVLAMEWVLQDTEHFGQTFEHLEWQPRETDMVAEGDEKPRVHDQIKRLLHVLQRVTTVDKDTLRKQLVEAYSTGETVEDCWSNVRTLVDQLMERYPRTDADYEIKVVGSTYKGGNLQFPRYPSFVRVVGEDPVLSYNDYERGQNADYMKLQDQEPDDAEEIEEDDFDF